MDELRSDDDAKPAPDVPAPSSAPGVDVRMLLRVVAVLAVCTVVLFRGCVGHDPTRVVPLDIRASPTAFGTTDDPRALMEADARVVVWLISRNAHALLHAPLSFFEAEQCAPADGVLAYGEAALSLGILALPAQLLFDDPVLTFNWVTLAIILISGLAMFLLVQALTGSEVAGIVAAIVYAFHDLKVSDIAHPMLWDSAWTVLAIYFASRWARRAHWRDVAGLWACISMQFGGSVYPLVSAALIGLPLAVSLTRTYGFAKPRPAQCAALALGVVVSGLVTLWPYLDAADTGSIAGRGFQAFRPVGYALPGGVGFVGWLAALLGLGALCVPRAWIFDDARNDLRIALVVGGVLVLSFSVLGGGEAGARTVAFIEGQPIPGGVPNLYLLLSSFVPALEVGRGPGTIYGGVHLVMSILSGLGAAALLARTTGNARAVVAGGLIMAAVVTTFWPHLLGGPRRADFEFFDIRPPDGDLVFFEDLVDDGVVGPYFEVPNVGMRNLFRTAKGVLRSAFHHQRTVYCYNSFAPDAARQAWEIEASITTAEAVDRLYALGFRALIIEHGTDVISGEMLAERIARFAGGEGRGRLERASGAPDWTAYRILGRP